MTKRSREKTKTNVVSLCTCLLSRPNRCYTSDLQNSFWKWNNSRENYSCGVVVESDSSASASISSPESREDAGNPAHPISGWTLRNGQIWFSSNIFDNQQFQCQYIMPPLVRFIPQGIYRPMHPYSLMPLRLTRVLSALRYIPGLPVEHHALLDFPKTETKIKTPTHSLHLYLCSAHVLRSIWFKLSFLGKQLKLNEIAKWYPSNLFQVLFVSNPPLPLLPIYFLCLWRRLACTEF